MHLICPVGSYAYNIYIYIQNVVASLAVFDFFDTANLFQNDHWL